ncbi:MAG: response regulator [Planctomycetes bacterium]|nr:response regulator [Planctomycetota bacterium]
MKFLVVDDSRAMRSIVMRTLRQAGFENHSFAEAQNGVEALKIIRESPPDLVFSDWDMPEMSGIELLKAMRSEKINISFGFVTSETSGEMMRVAVEAGASFFVIKPFGADELQRALANVLGS